MSRRRGSILNGDNLKIKDKRQKDGVTARLIETSCTTDCTMEIERFPEPSRNECGDCLYKWFSFILHPKMACWIIILTAILTASMIASVEECGTTFYLWEPKIQGKQAIGVVKQAIKLETNLSDPSGLKQSCYSADPNIEYMKKVYNTIQAVMVFMLTMTLGSGITKYKEEIRLFEALAGDVKALGMFLVHMTVDKEKYKLENRELKYKQDVLLIYERVRKLLGVIAPVARMVLKGKRLKRGIWNHLLCRMETVADRNELETYKNYQKYKPWEKNFYPFKMCPCDKRWLFGYWGDLWHENRLNCGLNCNWWFCGLCNSCFGEKHKRVKIYWSQHELWNEKINLKTQEEIKCIMKWDQRRAYEQGWCSKPKVTKYDLNKDYNEWKQKLMSHIPNDTEISLFKKIELVQQRSQLDLFETVMTVLVDELSKIAESNLGFGSDEGSAIRTEIYAKWDSIYASWGSMSSIKSYSEPTIVHLFRFSLLMAYACLMPYMYLESLSESVERYLAFVFLEVFVFAFLWYTAYAIRNPFQEVVCMRGVKPIASETQMQVLNLILSSLIYDRKDYEQNDSILKKMFRNEELFRRRSMISPNIEF